MPRSKRLPIAHAEATDLLRPLLERPHATGTYVGLSGRPATPPLPDGWLVVDYADIQSARLRANLAKFTPDEQALVVSVPWSWDPSRSTQRILWVDRNGQRWVTCACGRKDGCSARRVDD